MDGSLIVRVARRGTASVLVEARGTYPLQVLRPHPHPYGGSLGLGLVVLMPCGGLLDGDSLDVQVHVEDGASLSLTTAAATQLHAGRSVQRLRVRLGTDATFLYLPHELVPHRDADVTTTSHLQLGPGARLVWAEILSPGRLHRGERFAYHRLSSALDVSAGDTLLARERQLLCPATDDLETRLGGYTHMGTLYALRAAGGDAPPLPLPLPPVPAPCGDGDLLVGLSCLAGPGFLARGLGRRATDLSATFDALARQVAAGLSAAL